MGFTRMEQAERWVVRLEGESVDRHLAGDMDGSSQLEQKANQLKEVIAKVKCGFANPEDWKIFNQAVEARTLRDVMLVS